MPKVGGSNMDECMDICMSDDEFAEEEPNADKRRKICFAACSDYLEDKNTEGEETDDGGDDE